MSIIERAIESSDERKSVPGSNRSATHDAAGRSRSANSTGEPVQFAKLADANFLPTAGQAQRTVDQIRRIKRPLLMNAFGELAQPGANIIMVTSASPGAGKTFTAVNLAQALSFDRDRSVLLVDADNTKGSLTKALGLSEERGLFDALDDSSISLESIIRPTELPGLSIMPTGKRFRESEEILASRNAAEVLAKLGRRNPHRIIILDAPPVLPSTDALALAGNAGQILLVVGAGTTDQDSLRRAMELLNNGKPLGLVLNRAPISSWFPDHRGESYADYQR